MMRVESLLALAVCLCALARPVLAQHAARSSSGNRPLAKDFGLEEFAHLSKDLPHAEDGPWKLVCTMPYNCPFQPRISVEAPAGKVIKFNSSNPLVLYLTPTETCATDAGERVYEAKNWVSGEGAIYTIPAGVTVKAVKYRETGCDTGIVGSFECDDNDYKVLWKKDARTWFMSLMFTDKQAGSHDAGTYGHPPTEEE